MAEEKSRVEQLEEAISKKRAARDQAEEDQYATDLEARMSLEEDLGELAAVRVKFKPGQPTRAYLRTPTDPEYKRFFQTIQKMTRAKNDEGTKKAQEQLARSCWVYPTTPEARASMLLEYPALLVSIGLCAERLAGGKAEDEGKD